MPRKSNCWGLFWGALVLLCLCGCADAPQESYQPEYSVNPPAATLSYIFAPHPLLNPQKLAEVYGGMVDLINKRLVGDRIQLALEASSNYAAFNEKLKNRRVHFALPNPYQTVLSQDCGYVVFGKMDNDEDFRGVILVRKNSPVATLEQLKGQSVSFPAPTALAATMLPELYLKEHGVDPHRDITQLFVGTHDSAMMNVCIGVSSAACTWPQAWRIFQREQPEHARHIELRWQTESLPNNGLVALESVPEHVRYKVAQAFLHLHESPDGRRLLDLAGVTCFVAADKSAYDPVRAFIHRYSQQVRELKGLDE